jgi:patatin-like phospholipase/acyl hydrolase
MLNNDEQNPIEEDANPSVVVEDPEREMEEMEDLGGTRSLSEAEEETQHLSDLQSVLKSLSPRFKNDRMNDITAPIMVSRIFPDNYLDLNYLMVMSLIEEMAEESDDVDVVGIITGVQAVTSIGYEGRGIADRLEIAGVAHEEEMEKLSKELGLAG